MFGVYVSVPVACFRKGLAREYLETEPLPPPATCYGFLLSLVGEQKRTRHVGCRVGPVLLTRPPTSVVLRTVWRCKVENYWTSPSRQVHVLGSSQMSKLNAWLKAVLSQLLLANATAGSIRSMLSDDSWTTRAEETLRTVSWPALVSEWLGHRDDAPEVLGQKASSLLKAHKVLEQVVKEWLQNHDEFVIGLGCGENARPDYQQLLTGIELLVWLDSSGETGDGLEGRVRAALSKPVGATVTRFGGLSLGESTHLVDEVSPWDRVKDRFAGKPGRAFRVAEKGRLTLPVWVDHVGSKGTRFETGDLVELAAAGAEPQVTDLPVVRPHP